MIKILRFFIFGFFRWLIIVSTIFIFSSIALATYIYQIEPQWIQVKNLDITLPNLEENFEGWRILQVSDIHINQWMTEERLTNIVNLINQQQPDIIVLTGDFFSQSGSYSTRLDRLEERIIPKIPYAEEHPSLIKRFLNKAGFPIQDTPRRRYFDDDQITLINSLSKLKPHYKSFAILGNHDYATSHKLVREGLKDSDIITLRNRVYTIENKSSYLNIIGVDDVLYGKDDLDSVLTQIPDKGANILLVHEPDFAVSAWKTHRFQLQLSGHSHGGQIKIPFRKPPFLPPYGQRFPEGLYRFSDLLLYTNRGVGMAYPYIRFNCRPEITIFTLHSAKDN